MVMGINLIRVCQECLGQEKDELLGALVYLDEGAAEALHFAGGLPFFLQLGVRAVCSLETANPLDSTVDWNGAAEESIARVIIITSQLLSDAHRHILRCLRMQSDIQNCTIMTSISQEAHSACPGTPLGTDAFSEYRDLLLQDLQSSRTYENQRTSNGQNMNDVEDYGKSGLTISVRHLPLLLCPLAPKVFVLPSAGGIAAAPLSSTRENSLGPGLPGNELELSPDVDEHMPPGAILLAHFFQHLSAQLNLKFEIFTLGPLAHTVGKFVTDADGIGHFRQTAGLVIVDRSLDLITPACHGDSLIDRIYSCLPRNHAVPTLPAMMKKSTPAIKRPLMDLRIPTILSCQKETDEADIVRKVKMLKLVYSVNDFSNLREDFEVKLSEEGNDGGTDRMHGSLSSAWEFNVNDRLEEIFEKRTKDACLLIRKWLHNALRQENLGILSKPRLGTVTPNELYSLIKQLSEKPGPAIRHAGLLEIAKAAYEATSPVNASRWEAFASAERMLIQGVGDGIENLALQVRDLVISVQRGKTGLLSLKDALTLAIVAYAIAGAENESQSRSEGPFPWEAEHALKMAVVDAILSGPPEEHLAFLMGLEDSLQQHWQTALGTNPRNETAIQEWSDEQWDNWDEDGKEGSKQEEFGEMQLKLELHDRVEDVFKRLRCVAAKGSSIMTADMGQGIQRSFLHNLLTLILQNAEVPGLKHHTSTVGRLFKKGLGRFGLGHAKPRLADQKLLIVFVIGGFNATEVRDVKAAMSEFPNGPECMLGGTTLLTPDDMYNLLIGSVGQT